MAGIIALLNSVYGNWGIGWNPDYDAIHEASSATWEASSSINCLQGKGGASYIMRRGLADFDLSEVSPSLTIACAKLVMPAAAWASNYYDRYAVLVDATGVTAGNIGYGQMLGKATSLGSVLIPAGSDTGDQSYYKELIFNATGLAFLESKAGGLARLGLRVDEDIAYNPPANNEVYRFLFNPYDGTPGVGVPYIHINYIPTAAGYIWVEGTKLAYTDVPLDKRTKEGTKSGATNQTAGHLWVEGNNLRYIDSSGDERYIAGSQEGATGKTAGIIWVEGTKIRYIDSSGNERCFEGTAS